MGLSAETPLKKIRFGVIPVEGGANVKERFGPLIAHMEKVTGITFEVFTASSYQAIVTAMSHKNIEMAYFGPQSYVEAAQRAGAEAVAQELNKNGEPGYYGMIIARKNSKFKEVKDTKGTVFAFTDPNSASGYLVPNILFRRDMKVDPKTYFKQLKFSGSHMASILAVKNGAIDVAATNNIDLDRAIYTGTAGKEDFKTLWTSEIIPGAAIAVRKDLDQGFKDKVGKAITEFKTKKGLESMQNGGFRPAKDSSYDVVRYLVHLKKSL
jgi:phosphonate transport system substrate-binding protein